MRRRRDAARSVAGYGAMYEGEPRSGGSPSLSPSPGSITPAEPEGVQPTSPPSSDWISWSFSVNRWRSSVSAFSAAAIRE